MVCYALAFKTCPVNICQLFYGHPQALQRKVVTENAPHAFQLCYKNTKKKNSSTGIIYLMVLDIKDC